MPAFQAEVVVQHMAIQLLAELRAKGAATCTAGQATEDGSGNRAQRHTDRAGCQTNGHSGTDLTAGQRDAGSASSASGGTDGGTDLHGCTQ